MSDIGAAREAVRQMGLRLVETGLVVGTWGNVSVRVGDKMVVTPSGADYAALAAEDMPVVDLATGEWEGPKPSSERDLHRAVYLERKEINAVIHAHSPNASCLLKRGSTDCLVPSKVLLRVGCHARICRIAQYPRRR